jgi:hypothetical protein
MGKAIRYFLAVLIGTCCGELAFTIARHLEGFPFYTIRQWVTGKSAMSEIIYHPADNWIIPALEVFFDLSGVALGLLIVWWFQSVKNRRRERELVDRFTNLPPVTTFDGGRGVAHEEGL